MTVLLSSGTTLASCIVDPQKFWIDYNKNLFLTKDYINITCGFNNCTENATAELRREPNFLVRIPLEKIGSVFNGYSLLQSTMQDGTYNLVIQCSSELETRTIDINKLELSMHSSSLSYDILYPRDVITVRAMFNLNGNMITSNSRVSFDVFLGKKLTVLDARPNIPNSYWEIKARIPDDFDSFGTKDMELDATYDGHTVTTTIYGYAEVKDILTMDITSPSLLNPYKVSDTTDINITVKLSYKSMPLSPSSILRFEAKLNSNELTIRNIEYKDPSSWVLSVNVPKTMSSNEEYDLDIFVTYDNITRKGASLPVQFVLLLEGKIIDAAKSPVDTEIRLKSSGSEEKILTDTNGYYRAEVLPGNYETELIFPDIRARLLDVPISSSDDPFDTHDIIRYDFFASGSAKIFFLEFSLPFSKVYVTIPYKDSDFNENEVVVYKCENWNFLQRLCSGDWKQVSADIDKSKKLISLELNSLSAFAISERSSLNLDIQLDREHYAGDDVLLTGKTLDNKNNSVSNVKIDYSGAASGSVMSDSSGRFTIKFKAPDTEGEHHLTLEAKKDTYISVKVDVSFSVIKKRSLSVTVPASVDVDLGSSSQVNIIIRNDGQVDLGNIGIIIENIPPSWYTLSKKTIDKLGIGKDSVILMNLSIDCKDCKDQYDVLVRAESEVSATNSFIINLNNITQEKPPVTGFFIDMSSSFYFVIIAAALLAFFIYRKLSKKTGMKNRSVSADLDEIKIEALNRSHEASDIKKDFAAKKAKKLKDILKNPFE